MHRILPDQIVESKQILANSLQEFISGLVLELIGGYAFLGILVLDLQKKTWLVAKDWISSPWTGKRCRNLAGWAKIGTIAYVDLRTNYIAKTWLIFNNNKISLHNVSVFDV